MDAQDGLIMVFQKISYLPNEWQIIAHCICIKQRQINRKIAILN